MVLRKAAPLLLLPLLAGCGAGAVSYVSAGDPVLRACQTSAVQNLAVMQVSVDNANNTDSGGVGSGSGQMMSPAQINDLKAAAVSYRGLADEVSAHPGFASALRNEAQEFDVAASASDGLTSNTVAVATDRFASQIEGDCGSFQVGTAPKAGKPAPAANWGPFWFWAGIYAVMALVSGYLIALGQRSQPRGKRLKPAGVFWQSLVWWVFIFAALGRAYSHVIWSASLTRDEKKDDRIAAQGKKIAELESQLKKPSS